MVHFFHCDRSNSHFKDQKKPYCLVQRKQAGSPLAAYQRSLCDLDFGDHAAANSG